MREFNITGLCVPRMHYMVDTSAKIIEIAAMVEKGNYFTINRARQFGKTTTFTALREKLKPDYLVIDTSFEGIDDSIFLTGASFCKMFVKIIAEELEYANADAAAANLWYSASDPNDMLELGSLITAFCHASSKPVVLMVDEVDKITNNQVFLDFLGMLRKKFLKRNDGKDTTFQSVILAGVYDIKNLKRKITGEEILNARGERVNNSPWNIAADFLVDMSFHPDEIATMLTDYENDHHTGMDISAISHELYRYTNGYPFLVSKLCKTIDERLEKDWSISGVESAVKLLLREKNTLTDDMFNNIENNKDLYSLIFDIMIEGKEVAFSLNHPAINLGSMYGIICDKSGKAAVSNEIFELLIADYLSVDLAINTRINTKIVKSDIVVNGKFDMQICLRKFAQHYYEIFTDKDESFLESHGRILFITYLKPLINGQGFYHIETETRNAMRMDLAVDYGREQFIIEMKLWYGEKKHENAYRQLSEYLEAKHTDTGYLLTFDFRKGKRTRKAEWVEYNGKQIFDVII